MIWHREEQRGPKFFMSNLVFQRARHHVENGRRSELVDRPLGAAHRYEVGFAGWDPAGDGVVEALALRRGTRRELLSNRRVRDNAPYLGAIHSQRFLASHVLHQPRKIVQHRASAVRDG